MSWNCRSRSSIKADAREENQTMMHFISWKLSLGIQKDLVAFMRFGLPVALKVL